MLRRMLGFDVYRKVVKQYLPRVILGLSRGYIGVILGLCWGYIGVMDEKMETTIMGYILHFGSFTLVT